MPLSTNQLGAFLIVTALSSACSDDNGGGGSGGGAGSAGTPSGGAGGSTAGSSGAGGKADTGGTGNGGNNSGGTDTGGDAGDDGNAGEGGSAGEGGNGDDPWEHCPSAEDFDDDASWPNVLDVTADAIYCASFDENRTLKEELAAKALLRVAPGRYRLPDDSSSDLGLPMCVQFGENGTPIALPAHEMTYSTRATDNGALHEYYFRQRIENQERRLTLHLYREEPAGTAPGFVLNGAEVESFDADAYGFGFSLFKGFDAKAEFEGLFDSCTHESSRLNRHDVVLDDGNVSLELRIGQSLASTEPGAFVRASGTFRGYAFDQRNYFKLVYNPEHHHFARDFAVLFDEPVGDACGIEIDVDDTLESATAFSVDCALDHLETLTVTSHTLTRDP